MKQSLTNRFKGIIANLPTPYKEDGSIDIDAFEKIIEHCVDEGVHGVACLLSSGTFTYMTEEERHTVIKVVLDTVRNRVPVIAGVNSSTTEGTIRFADKAFEAGISGALILPLSYWPLTVNEVVEHFTKIVTAVDGTFGIYNNPKLTGIDIKGNMYKELFDLGNISFTKDSSGVLERVLDIKTEIKDGFDYLCGTEVQLLPSLKLGAEGACIAIASMLTSECVSLYNYATLGDMAKAFEYHQRLVPMFKFFQKYTVIRSVRLLGELLGYPMGKPRKPLTMIESEDAKNELRSILLDNGLLK